MRRVTSGIFGAAIEGPEVAAADEKSVADIDEETEVTAVKGFAAAIG